MRSLIIPVVLLAFASVAQAQGARFRATPRSAGGRTTYDMSVVNPNGSQVNLPYTMTPYGMVYDPNGFLGHQYINEAGVGNGGVPIYIDSNNQTGGLVPFGYNVYTP